MIATRDRIFDSERSFLEFPRQFGHFDSGFGGAAAGVEALSGLFFGVGGEDAENDGDTGVDGDALDSAGGFAGDEVEMRRFAAYDGAEADDGGEFSGVGGQSCGDGQFECAGNAVNGRASGLYAEFGKTLDA